MADDLFNFLFSEQTTNKAHEVTPETSDRFVQPDELSNFLQMEIIEDTPIQETPEPIPEVPEVSEQIPIESFAPPSSTSVQLEQPQQPVTDDPSKIFASEGGPDALQDQPKVQPKKAFIEGVKQTTTAFGGFFKGIGDVVAKRYAEAIEIEKANLQPGETSEHLAELQENYEFTKSTGKIGEKILKAKILEPDESFKKAPGMVGYIQDVIMVAPQIAGVVASTTLGGPGAGLAFTGTQIAGTKYKQLTEEGIKHDRAFIASLADAALQAPLEQIGIGKALKAFKPGRVATKAFKEIAESGATEFLTEAVQKYPEAVTEIWARTEGKTNKERVEQFVDNFWEITKDGVKEGLVALPFGVGISGAGVALRETTKQPDAKLIDSFKKGVDELSKDVQPGEQTAPSEVDQVKPDEVLPDITDQVVEPIEPEEQSIKDRVQKEQREKFGIKPTKEATPQVEKVTPEKEKAIPKKEKKEPENKHKSELGKIKWYTGESESFDNKQTQYLTTKPDFAKTYGDVFSVETNIPDEKILRTDNRKSVKIIVDKMFGDYENGYLSQELDEVINFTIEESSNDIDTAKESLIDQLSPKEIENESSYDNPDITEYISENTNYDAILFGDKTTALLLDVPNAKFDPYKELGEKEVAEKPKNKPIKEKTDEKAALEQKTVYERYKEISPDVATSSKTLSDLYSTAGMKRKYASFAKDLKIKVLEDPEGGGFYDKNKTIYIKSGLTEKQFNKVLEHEVEHAIITLKEKRHLKNNEEEKEVEQRLKPRVFKTKDIEKVKDETPLKKETVKVEGQDVNITPSEAQKEAGNYKKAHIKKDGMDISIENPAGSIRTGTDSDGETWSQEMKADYGYIKGTVGKDKDHIDIYLKPGAKENGKVFVVNQVDTKTKKFDEHKAVLYANTEEEALKIYNSNYEKGWQGAESVVEMSTDEFKEWAYSEKPKQGRVDSVVAKSVPVEEKQSPLLKGEKAVIDKIENKKGKIVQKYKNEHGNTIIEYKFESDLKNNKSSRFLTVFEDGYIQTSKTGKKLTKIVDQKKQIVKPVEDITTTKQSTTRKGMKPSTIKTYDNTINKALKGDEKAIKYLSTAVLRKQNTKFRKIFEEEQGVKLPDGRGLKQAVSDWLGGKKEKKSVQESRGLPDTKEDNLIKEAKKYKSAEQFVERNATLYHGTKVNIKTFKPSKSVGTHGESDQVEGIYFTENKDAANFFALKENDERFLKKANVAFKNPLEVKDIKDLKEKLGIEKLADANKKAKDLGHDGILIDKGFFTRGGPHKAYIAFNSEQIKTKEQLTDIWNKANKKTQPSETTPEQTKEEFYKKVGDKPNNIEDAKPKKTPKIQESRGIPDVPTDVKGQTNEQQRVSDVVSTARTSKAKKSADKNKQVKAISDIAKQVQHNPGGPKKGSGWLTKLDTAYFKVKEIAWPILKMRKVLTERGVKKEKLLEGMDFAVDEVRGAADAAGQYIKDNYSPMFEPFTKMGAKEGGRVARDLSRYLVAKRTVWLYNNKDGYEDAGISIETAETVVDYIENGDHSHSDMIKDISQKVWAYNKGLIEIKHKAGVIDDQLVQNLKEPFYVPHYRDIDTGIHKPSAPRSLMFTATSTGIKRVKGSKSGHMIIDPLQLMISTTHETIVNASRAKVAQNIIKIAEEYPDVFGDMISELPPKWMKAGSVEHRVQVDGILKDQIESFIKKSGVGIKHVSKLGVKGLPGSKKRLGIFDTYNQEIRVLFGATESTKAHELGHLLDRDHKWLSETLSDKAYKDELQLVADSRYEGREVPLKFKRYVRQQDEKIAEFISLYLTNRPMLISLAPKAFVAFENKIKNDTKLKGLIDIKPSNVRKVESFSEDNYVLDNSIPLDEDVISLRRDGKLVHYRVPVEMAQAVKNLHPKQLPNWMKWTFSLQTRMLRFGAVGGNIGFAFPNVTKDQIDAAHNVKIIPFVDWFIGATHFIKGTEVAKLMIRRGGGMGSPESGIGGGKKGYYDIFYGKAGRILPKQFLDPFYWKSRGVLKGTGDLSLYAIKYPFKPILGLIELSEAASRVGVFRRHLKESGVDINNLKGKDSEFAIKEAVHATRHSTIDFNRFGYSGKLPNEVIPFVNAALEGVDRAARSWVVPIQEGRLPTRQIMFTTLTFGIYFGLTAWNRRDDEYKNISSREKANNWIFMKGDGTYFKIPKGHVTQMILNPAQMIFESIEGLSQKTGWGLTVDLFTDISPIDPGSLVPVTLKLFIEPITNYDLYWSNTIESQTQRANTPGYRYKKSTSENLKTIGEALNISPIMMQHEIRLAFGGLGRDILWLTDYVLGVAGVQKPPGLELENAIIVKRFLGKVEEWQSDSAERIRQIDKRLAEIKRAGKGARIKRLKQMGRSSKEIKQTIRASRRELRLLHTRKAKLKNAILKTNQLKSSIGIK